MINIPTILETIPVVITANTAHLDIALKEDITAFIIDVSYNFNHVGISDSESIKDIWASINGIHSGQVANWFLTTTSRFRAMNGLIDYGQALSTEPAPWDLYCVAIASALDLVPTLESSLLDNTTRHNVITKSELLSHLRNNPWLVFYLSIYLSTSISIKPVK